MDRIVHDRHNNDCIGQESGRTLCTNMRKYIGAHIQRLRFRHWNKPQVIPLQHSTALRQGKQVIGMQEPCIAHSSAPSFPCALRCDGFLSGAWTMRGVKALNLPETTPTVVLPGALFSQGGGDPLALDRGESRIIPQKAHGSSRCPHSSDSDEDPNETANLSSFIQGLVCSGVPRTASGIQITDCAQPLTLVVTPQLGVLGPCSLSFCHSFWVFFAVAPQYFS